MGLKYVETQPSKQTVLHKKITKDTNHISTQESSSGNESPLIKEKPTNANSKTVQQYLDSNEIRIVGADPKVHETFAEINFPQSIQKAIQRQGYEKPTLIQSASLPYSLEGKDCLAIAKTGSGKTAGYLLPAIKRILQHPPTTIGAEILIIAPTRELCQQIEEEAKKFAQPCGLNTVALFGGCDKGTQIRDMRYKKPEILVVTPGRCLDFMENPDRFSGEKIVRVENISMLILDEADRMLDMGFEKDILKIIDQIPNRKQTLFFTATWPKKVNMMAKNILSNPVEIRIGNPNQLNANKDIKQVIKIVSQVDKWKYMYEHIQKLDTNQKCIVFVNKKYKCPQYAQQLKSYGYKTDSLHGDKTQGERDIVMRQFKTGIINIVITTDVCARGLDVKGVDVFNVDFPLEIENYIHRIGRSGRAGEKGCATTLFSDDDFKFSHPLVQILKNAEQEVPQELERLAQEHRYKDKKGSYGFKKGGFRNNNNRRQNNNSYANKQSSGGWENKGTWKNKQ